MKLEDINNYLIGLFTPILGKEWKYYKSYRHFRKKEGFGYSYIILDTGTHDNASYYFSYRAWLRHDNIEKKELELTAPQKRIDHYSRTISLYGMNIGPNSQYWKSPIPGRWSFFEESDFEHHNTNIVNFLTTVVLPFISENKDLENIKQTFLITPEKTADFKPWRKVLLIEDLKGSHTSLNDTYLTLKEIFKIRQKSDQLDLDQIYEQLKNQD